MKDKIFNWVALQPLTGGMYLGFNNVLGNWAQCIISYKGLDKYTEPKNTEDKTDKRGNCGNEYNLTEYISKVQHKVVFRYEFADAESMFDSLGDNPVISLHGSRLNSFDKRWDLGYAYEQVDIVCAVPVCSGLSMLTTNNVDKERKNNNMIELAKYALKIIKPKIYIFENAPGFMGSKGEKLRSYFEDLAEETGYSISYFKTDTQFHYNCQRRPRTFVMFVQWRNGKKEGNPDFTNWEHETRTLTEMLSEIPKDATYQDSLPIDLYENITTIKYAKETWGDNWKEHFKSDVINELIKDGKINDFDVFCINESLGDTPTHKLFYRMHKHIGHIYDCKKANKGWWSAVPKYYGDLAPAIQSRTLYNTIHPTEDRLLNEREFLTLMGMPYDFEMKGNFMSCGQQIGQNVPVKTAEWIAKEAKRIIENWETIERPEWKKRGRYFNNIEMKEIEMK